MYAAGLGPRILGRWYIRMLQKEGHLRSFTHCAEIVTLWVDELVSKTHAERLKMFTPLTIQFIELIESFAAQGDFQPVISAIVHSWSRDAMQYLDYDDFGPKSGCPVLVE